MRDQKVFVWLDCTRPQLTCSVTSCPSECPNSSQVGFFISIATLGLKYFQHVVNLFTFTHGNDKASPCPSLLFFSHDTNTRPGFDVKKKKKKKVENSLDVTLVLVWKCSTLLSKTLYYFKSYIKASSRVKKNLHWWLMGRREGVRFRHIFFEFM